jgi:hypothetical protein
VEDVGISHRLPLGMAEGWIDRVQEQADGIAV